MKVLMTVFRVILLGLVLGAVLTSSSWGAVFYQEATTTKRSGTVAESESEPGGAVVSGSPGQGAGAARGGELLRCAVPMHRAGVLHVCVRRLRPRLGS